MIEVTFKFYANDRDEFVERANVLAVPRKGESVEMIGYRSRFQVANVLHIVGAHSEITVRLDRID